MSGKIFSSVIQEPYLDMHKATIMTSVPQQRMYFLVTTRTFLGLTVEQISSFQEGCLTMWHVKRLSRI